jgi:hypothetical protein
MREQQGLSLTRRLLLKGVVGGAAGLVLGASRSVSAAAPQAVSGTTGVQRLADDLFVLQLPGEANVVAQTSAAGVVLVDGGSAKASGALMKTIGALPGGGQVQTLSKDATIEARYPDGKRETLLNVPRYDFNWQIVYYQKQPLRLPKGTELHLTGHWDNSAANKWNPDPTAHVRWGDQSWQEMLSAPMGIIVDRRIDPKTVIERGAFAPGVQ